MAFEPVPIAPEPVEPDRAGWPTPATDRSCWPEPPVRGVDWFLRMPNGGGTVYRRP